MQQKLIKQMQKLLLRMIWSLQKLLLELHMQLEQRKHSHLHIHILGKLLYCILAMLRQLKFVHLIVGM